MGWGVKHADAVFFNHLFLLLIEQLWQSHSVRKPGPVLHLHSRVLVRISLSLFSVCASNPSRFHHLYIFWAEKAAHASVKQTDSDESAVSTVHFDVSSLHVGEMSLPSSHSHTHAQIQTTPPEKVMDFKFHILFPSRANMHSIEGVKLLSPSPPPPPPPPPNPPLPHKLGLS